MSTNLATGGSPRNSEQSYVFYTYILETNKYYFVARFHYGVTSPLTA